MENQALMMDEKHHCPMVAALPAGEPVGRGWVGFNAIVIDGISPAQTKM